MTEKTKEQAKLAAAGLLLFLSMPLWSWLGGLISTDSTTAVVAGFAGLGLLVFGVFTAAAFLFDYFTREKKKDNA